MRADELPRQTSCQCRRLLLQNLPSDEQRGIFLAFSDDLGLITEYILRPGFNYLELALQSHMNSLSLITEIPLSYPQGVWFCLLY